MSRIEPQRLEMLGAVAGTGAALVEGMTTDLEPTAIIDEDIVRRAHRLVAYISAAPSKVGTYAALLSCGHSAMLRDPDAETAHCARCSEGPAR